MSGGRVGHSQRDAGLLRAVGSSGLAATIICQTVGATIFVAPGQTDTVRGQVVRSGGRVLDPAIDGFIVELTASEAEVNAFVTDLGRRAELLEVVRSGALGISRSARPLRARALPASA